MFLFEVSDKAFPIATMYVFVSGTGLLGGILGVWRWWAGALWFFGPTLFFLLVVSVIQMDEIESLYENLVSELGYGYVVHSYVTPVLAILLNLSGISVGIARRFRQNAINRNTYADTTSIGRI